MTATSISPLLRFCLRLIGAWPYASYNAVYQLVFMMCLLIVQYFQYLYVFTHLRFSELANLADNLPVTLDYTLSIFKLLILWMQHRVMRQILTTMDCDWRECVNNDRHLCAMTVKAELSRFCANAIIGLYAMIGVFYFLINSAISSLYVADGRNDTSRQLPVKVQLPFDAEQSPTFELLAIILSVQGVINSLTVATVNALILALVLHASGQIDIVCQEFRNISEKAPLYGSSASTLVMLIERHNRVITFSDNIDKLISFIAFMQIIGNTLVICSVGFLVIVSLHNETDVVTLMKGVTAYFSVSLEIFMFCIAGEYLSDKSKLISNAAYESLWYNLPSDQIKVISFMLMRSQRQMTITTGGIMDLSLEAFTSIMKASASYISVLYAMY